jgi:hypothetical protein
MHVLRLDGTPGVVQSMLVVQQPARMYNLSVAEARIVGSFSNGVQVRAMGPDTDEWVRVRSLAPMLSGWMCRADSAELRQ